MIDDNIVTGNREHNDSGELVGVAPQADAGQRPPAGHGGISGH